MSSLWDEKLKTCINSIFQAINYFFKPEQIYSNKVPKWHRVAKCFGKLRLFLLLLNEIFQLKDCSGGPELPHGWSTCLSDERTLVQILKLKIRRFLPSFFLTGLQKALTQECYYPWWYINKTSFIYIQVINSTSSARSTF